MTPPPPRSWTSAYLSVTAQLVELGEKYFVKEPELWNSGNLIYSSVLKDTVANHRSDVDDLTRLITLKDTLGLSAADVAACHQQVRVLTLKNRCSRP